jgi:hypothetical protein
MARSLVKLLSEPDDFKLCDGLCAWILQRHRNAFDPPKATECERVVVLVWTATGIIENGGFRYLLEGDFHGDPGFQLTADSFDRIGCHPAAEAFRETLARFPGGRPHANIRSRLTHYLKQFRSMPTNEDGAFFRAGKSIVRCLARYIREHRGEFEGLKPLAKRQTAARKQKPATKSRQSPQPTRLDVAVLPHWARVAFAARCARLLLPVFQMYWPAASTMRLPRLQQAVEEAEESARKGRPTKGLKSAALDALITAGAALLGSVEHSDEEAPKEDGPPDSSAGTIASIVARAVEHAARAALASAAESADAASEALAFALQAAAAAEDEAGAESIRRAYIMLHQAAERNHWSDRSSVAADTLDEF